jgi:competence protein ComEA
LPGLVESIHRRKEIVAILTVLVPLGALIVSVAEQPRYEATASVLVQPREEAGVSPTEVIELAEAPKVEQRTAEERGGTSPFFVSDRVAVEGSDASDLFTIEASSGNPRYAARLANTYAEEFVEYTAELGDSFPARAKVFERAAPPKSPASPKTVRNTLLGLGTGLLLGIVVALLWGRLDRGARREAARPVQAATATAMPDGPIELNDVTYEQLRALNLSTTQARRLLTYRERRGGFRSVNEIDDVPGFPENLRRELKRRVSV